MPLTVNPWGFNYELPKVALRIPGLAELHAVNGTALVIRTALEDRMLRGQLAEYAAYTEETPYRLIPGLW